MAVICHFFLDKKVTKKSRAKISSNRTFCPGHRTAKRRGSKAKQNHIILQVVYCRVINFNGIDFIVICKSNCTCHILCAFNY